jgi:Domain of unknown function (DUF1906)
MTTPTPTAPLKGCDYSTSRPNPTQMKAAGIKFVVRYVSPGVNPKNLTKPELTALLGAGFEVAVVFESTEGRMKDGHGAGAWDATVADTELKALGLTGLPCYFAADWDVQPSELAACDAYLDGVASVIGHARTGVYGGLRIVKHALDNAKAAYAWQSYAWSGGVWDTRAQLRQVKNGVSLAGGEVDIDEAHAADFGQWPRPKPPAPPGPFRHVVPAGNQLSLAKVAGDRGTTVDHIAEVTHASADPAHVAVFDAYLALCKALRAADLPRTAMPEGMVYFTTNP